MTTRLTFTNADAITAMRACRKLAETNGACSPEEAAVDDRKAYAELALNLARRLRARGVASAEIEEVLKGV